MSCIVQFCSNFSLFCVDSNKCINAFCYCYIVSFWIHPTFFHVWLLHTVYFLFDMLVPYSCSSFVLVCLDSRTIVLHQTLLLDLYFIHISVLCSLLHIIADIVSVWLYMIYYMCYISLKTYEWWIPCQAKLQRCPHMLIFQAFGYLAYILWWKQFTSDFYT